MAPLQGASTNGRRSRLARDYSSGILPGSYSASPIKNPLSCIYNVASLAALGIHPAPFCAAFTRGSTTFRLPSKSFTREPRVRQKPRAAADALPGAKNMAPLQGASTDGRRSRLARDYSSGILPSSYSTHSLNLFPAGRRSRLARDYSSGILPGSYSASPIKNPLRCIYNVASLAALGKLKIKPQAWRVPWADGRILPLPIVN